MFALSQFCRFSLIAVLLTGAAWPLVAADPAPSTDVDPVKQQQADFRTLLTGAKLVGTFTIEGKAGETSDGYEIVRARPLSGRNWEVTSTMKIGEKSVEIPIVVQVDWVAGTPVMSLTDLTIPGLGTFSSRILFDGRRYAGTWQHGEVGGHMLGIVERAKP